MPSEKATDSSFHAPCGFEHLIVGSCAGASNLVFDELARRRHDDPHVLSQRNLKKG